LILGLGAFGLSGSLSGGALAILCSTVRTHDYPGSIVSLIASIAFALLLYDPDIGLQVLRGV
jgi:hypothetical protein